ncbi:hypothetical protein E2C01_076385 [Portunus trituberculatus]|uniref:Uncharacterized protein n=1 Tax=Portunus trituberculatus TaxID=210409 RepID=A0A5B7ID44_PORTR|nr:hypothetical protein [Portunus trituberculatus]
MLNTGTVKPKPFKLHLTCLLLGKRGLLIKRLTHLPCHAWDLNMLF